MAVITVGDGADAASRLDWHGLAERRPGGFVFAIPAVAVAFAIAATLVFSGWSTAHVVDPSVRSALETAVTLSAAFSTVLLVANFRQTRLLKDLVLLGGIVTAGLTGFVFNTLPGYGYETGIYGAGARSALMILVVGAFIAVAFLPRERLVARGRRAAILAIPVAVGVVALGELVDLLVGPVHPAGPAGDFRAVSVMLATVSCSGLLVAVYGFLRGSALPRTDARLLASAATLLALANTSRLRVAVVPQDWLTATDGLRLGLYLLLFAVSLRLYRVSQAQKASAAIEAERQRIAHDLHDGLAQDLAFIASHSERLAREYGSDHPLTIAAQRALAVSRAQIVDLEGSAAPDTAAALRAVAQELAHRFGVQVNVEVEPGACTRHSASDRSQLVRIAREAIANAIRHGGARSVAVTLGARQEDGLLLRVTDDGRGFAQAAPETAGTGLGMETMRERAGKLGARLTTRRSESGHTELDVRTVGAGRRRVAGRRR